MKRLLPACLLLGLMSAATSCHKPSEELPSPAICLATCPDAGDVFKTATNVRGIVRQNALTKEYSINTYAAVNNAVDVGLLCGALPAGLQAEGTKVIFSGTYRLKAGALPGGDVSVFYLSLSALSPDPNP